MVKFKGEAELEIAGKKRSFIWNMAALCLLGDLQNVSMTEMAREFLKPKFSTIQNFLYVGAVGYCKANKTPIDFTQENAAEWLDEIGIEKTLDLLEAAFNTPKDPDAEKKPESPGVTTWAEKVSQWDFEDYLIFAVTDLKLSPDQFWLMSWYELGLHILRYKKDNLAKFRESESKWVHTRLIVTTIVNRFRGKDEKVLKPSDLIRLSFDDELEALEQAAEPEEDLFEKLTALYGKTLETKPADGSS